MRGPLEGVRVIELARILAGPWAGQTLADLGAEVVKVEAPEGDDTRQWGPPFIDRPGDGPANRSAAYFHATNRGKTAIAVDFRTPEGQARVRDLVRGADVVIENFKAGGLAKYGLDYPALAGLNPGLVYCSITGFGQTGPYAERAGYDYIIQGMAGLMSVTGDPAGQPQKVGVAVVDVMTGVYAATAILAALHQRFEQAARCRSGVDLVAAGADAPVLAGRAKPRIQPPCVSLHAGIDPGLGNLARRGARFDRQLDAGLGQGQRAIQPLPGCEGKAGRKQDPEQRHGPQNAIAAIPLGPAPHGR